MSIGSAWDNIYSQVDLYNFKHEFYPFIEDDYSYYGSFTKTDHNPYDSPLIIQAFLEDGTEVAVYKNKDFYFFHPEDDEPLVDLTTFSLEGIQRNVGARPDYPDMETINSNNGKDENCTARMWVDGKEAVSDDSIVSSDKPSVAAIEACTGEMDSNSLKTYMEAITCIDGIVFIDDLEKHRGLYFRHWFTDYCAVRENRLFSGSLDEFEIRDFMLWLAPLFKITDQYGVELSRADF